MTPKKPGNSFIAKPARGLYYRILEVVLAALITGTAVGIFTTRDQVRDNTAAIAIIVAWIKTRPLVVPTVEVTNALARLGVKVEDLEKEIARQRLAIERSNRERLK